MAITAETSVEELLERYPWANAVLIQLGLPCVHCGEPFWGTLGELVENYGRDIDEILAALNEERGICDK
ncbi:MAG: DUF1858 domain-containing protein [Candidatus Coatesbacteria bacterium]|nr:MAG: DUF1858 domain-containing protein [Candidatus Coatesbacteria bacterium]